MRSQREETIAGRRYVLQQLSATDGMVALVYISKVFAGASEGVGFSTAKEMWDTPINPAGVLAGMVKALSVDGSPAFVKKLVLDSCVVPDFRGGKEQQFDDWFAGKYDELASVVYAIIDHNGFAELVKKNMGTVLSQLFSSKETPPSIPSSPS
jgi:Phage tail assembly chaperone protein, TAC